MPPVEANVQTLLIASIVIVSILAWTSDKLRHLLILNPYVVTKRMQIWRLLTAAWIHSDVTHLLMNMLTLWFFAGRVVLGLGSTKFIALYIAAAFVGFIPTTIRFMNRPNYNSLGASGAVAAILFSAICLFPDIRVGIAFLPFAVPGYLYAVLYLAYSVYHSYRSRDGINHDAHFSGAVFGAVATYLFEPERVTTTIRHILN